MIRFLLLFVFGPIPTGTRTGMPAHVWKMPDDPVSALCAAHNLPVRKVAYLLMC